MQAPSEAFSFRFLTIYVNCSKLQIFLHGKRHSEYILIYVFHLLSSYCILLNLSNGEIVTIEFVDINNLKTSPIEEENINLNYRLSYHHYLQFRIRLLEHHAPTG
jgi:hypothetical protein